jgi:hypothetical protein
LGVEKKQYGGFVLTVAPLGVHMRSLVDTYEKMNDEVVLTEAPPQGLSVVADTAVPE